MNILKKIRNFSSWWESISRSSKRFPLWICCMIAVGFLAFCINYDVIDESEAVIKLILSCIAVFFYSISWIILSEAKKGDNIYIIWTQIISIIAGVAFYLGLKWMSDNFSSILFVILGFTGSISLLFIAGLITQNNAYYKYFYSMVSAFILAFFIGILILWLWFVWIWAIFTLFDIQYIWDTIFFDWFILSCILFAPMYGLSKIPYTNTIKNTQVQLHSFLEFIIKYIGIPAITFYFIILYIYSIRLGFDISTWPKWEISWLIIGFSILWYIMYIISFPLERKYKYIQVFRKVFPYIVLPQVLLLFYSIYLRISQYDITINRYLVVIFWILLWIISLYYIFSKDKKLWITMWCLTCTIIFVSIWPWSVYNLPESRQINILKEKLTEWGILKSDNTIHRSVNIDPVLGWEIYNIIDYICDYHSCDSLKKIFPEIYSSLQKEKKQDENTEISDWEFRNAITETLWVQRYYPESKKQTEYISIYLNHNDIFPLSVKKYHTIYQFDHYHPEDQSIKIQEKVLWEQQVSVKEIIEKIKQNNRHSNHKYTKEELSFKLYIDGTPALLIITDAHLSTQRNKKHDYQNMRWYILIE